MRAALVDRYGPPNVLQILAVDDPRPGPGELLVRVGASVVTEGDRRLRASDFPGVSWLPGRLMMGILKPRQSNPGTMFAGEVVALGPGVTGFSLGDDIFGSVNHSAYAELLVVKAEGPIAKMPPGSRYAEAAAMPYGAGTALTFLEELGEVKPGERVLILGASGGVGRFAVQVAKHLGAHVTGVCSAKSADVARRAGADEVIDYLAEDFRDRGAAYDLILDTADVATFSDVRRSLSQTGRFLTLFVSLGVIFNMIKTRIFGGQRAIFGVDMGSQEGMTRIAELWSQGVVTPLVDRRFELGDIAKAHAYQESRPSQGAVVVEMAMAMG